MAPELWATLALALLTVATVAISLKLFQVAGPWMLVAMVARLAACLVLVLALLQIGWGDGGGAIPAPRREPLAAALATLAVYLILVWRLKEDAAAPVVDLVAISLILTAIFAKQQPLPDQAHLQHGVFRQVLWGMLLVGVGGIWVAGSTGLMLALRAGLRDRTPELAWPDWLDLHTLLRHATMLSLVTLGAALVVGGWWAWRAGGAVASGGGADGLAWLAITWLFAAMSQLARGVGKRWECFTVSLALVSALTALVGLWMLEAPASFL